MITDAQTNFVYFSEILQTNTFYEPFRRNLTLILDKHNIDYDFLPDTNDIWCRDYMPIQVTDNNFIEYRYDPDSLLSKKERNSKTYPDLVCGTINLKTTKTGLILDGGNVIKSADKVILTDKVFVENKHRYTNDQVVSILKSLFTVHDIIIIPWDRENEEYGYADGIIRFISETKVLINGYFKIYDSKFRNAFFSALSEHNLAYTELNYDVPTPNEELNCGYINYLQLKELILFPKFGIDEDEQALEQIKTAFPDYASKGQIETINCSEIIKH